MEKQVISIIELSIPPSYNSSLKFKDGVYVPKPAQEEKIAILPLFTLFTPYIVY